MNANQIEELKPCPFCGGKAILHERELIKNKTMSDIHCVKCRHISCDCEASDTPRTNDQARRLELSSGWCYAVRADFARTLERELVATQSALKECGEALNTVLNEVESTLDEYISVERLHTPLKLHGLKNAQYLIAEALSNPLVKKVIESK